MDEKIDKNFINDVFWLLFPFQIVWDPTLTFEEEENDKDPISGETVQNFGSFTTKTTAIPPEMCMSYFMM